MKKYQKGFTDGVYDMFHVGHLNMIKAAKAYCDYLIVGVHSDEIVQAYKGKPTIINENDRREIVAAIRDVNQAVINHTRDKLALHKLHGFDVIFIGDDWKGTERWIAFENELRKVGVDVVYIPYTKRISTTKIRQQIEKSKK